jgi:hypothetical protein
VFVSLCCCGLGVSVLLNFSLQEYSQHLCASEHLYVCMQTEIVSLDGTKMIVIGIYSEQVLCVSMFQNF